jgi:hypothetical protein
VRPRRQLGGQRFGRLTLVKELGPNAHGSIVWRCHCDCGNDTMVTASNLRSGNTISRGCFHKERQHEAPLRHGMKGTRVYNAWINMRQRCTNPARKEWENYGGRGISVCDDWMVSFDAFLQDMGEPQEGMTLDRFDVNGDYEPGNCRWASYQAQGRNTRDNRMVTYQSRTQSLADWADELGIAYWTLHVRFRRGWSTERALSTPTRTCIPCQG